MKSTILIFFITLVIGLVSGAPPTLEEIKRKENPEYWQNLGLTEILSTLKSKPNENIAKNIIIFIGDGMGGSTITASRWYKRQKKNIPNLSFESFPYTAMTQVSHLGVSRISSCHWIFVYK